MMATRACVFSRHLTHQVDCPHCGTHYSFARRVMVKRQVEDAELELAGAEASAAAQLLTLSQDHGCATVRCPSCRRLGPNMRGAHLLMGLTILAWLGLCAGAAWFVFGVEHATGVVGLLLGILIGTGTAIGILAFVKWLFGGYVSTGEPARR